PVRRILLLRCPLKGVRFPSLICKPEEFCSMITDKEVARLERQAADARKRADELTMRLGQAQAAAAVEERRRALLDGDGDIAAAERKAAEAECVAGVADAVSIAGERFAAAEQAVTKARESAGASRSRAAGADRRHRSRACGDQISNVHRLPPF